MPSRPLFLILCVVISSLLGAQSAKTIDGSWKGVISALPTQGCTLNLTLRSSHYTEQIRCSGKNGSENGEYDFSNGVVTLHASDWGPAPLPRPSSPGRFPASPSPATVRPLEGIYKVDFPTSRSMIWHETNSASTISFTRVQ